MVRVMSIFGLGTGVVFLLLWGFAGNPYMLFGMCFPLLFFGVAGLVGYKTPKVRLDLAARTLRAGALAWSFDEFGLLLRSSYLQVMRAQRHSVERNHVVLDLVPRRQAEPFLKVREEKRKAERQAELVDDEQHRERLQALGVEHQRLLYECDQAAIQVADDVVELNVVAVADTLRELLGVEIVDR